MQDLDLSLPVSLSDVYTTLLAHNHVVIDILCTIYYKYYCLFWYIKETCISFLFSHFCNHFLLENQAFYEELF